MVSRSMLGLVVACCGMNMGGLGLSSSQPVSAVEAAAPVSIVFKKLRRVGFSSVSFSGNAMVAAFTGLFH